jgi:hypothetical protein
MNYAFVQFGTVAPRHLLRSFSRRVDEQQQAAIPQADATPRTTRYAADGLIKPTTFSEVRRWLIDEDGRASISTIAAVIRTGPDWRESRQSGRGSHGRNRRRADGAFRRKILIMGL